MLPNLSQTVLKFSQQIELIKTVQTVVNFKPVLTEIPSTINAVVQPSTDKALASVDVDVAKSYYTIHTSLALKIGDFVIIKTKRHKLIKSKDYSEYGYYEFVAEEVK